jgi:predicted transposase/invertase (TIGR01784 family)
MTKDILPPKNDVVFKLLFGDKRNGDLLADFLKAVINLPEDDYSEITVVDPHLMRKHPDKKLGILDLKIKTKSGKIVHVEIQLWDFPQMRERIIFYDAGLITDQIDAGEDYGSIKRVITILITDYVLIPESLRYHNRFTLNDPETAIEFTDLIEIHTLELPKLPETADNYLWHWLRFLRAQSKEDLDMIAQASPKLQKTVVKLLELSEDEEARMIYDAEVKAARDEQARMRGAFEKGVVQGKAEGKVEGKAKGLAEGKVEGKAEGLVEGKVEGKKEKALEIARKLIDFGIPIEKIADATALSYEEIEKLRT